MAKESILIGCRLPNGLVLHHPKNKNLTVKLVRHLRDKAGKRSLYAADDAFSTTAVDLEFWTAWKAAYAGFPPLKTRAVFEARSDQEATAKAKDTSRLALSQMGKSAMMDGVKLEQGDLDERCSLQPGRVSGALPGVHSCLQRQSCALCFACSLRLGFTSTIPIAASCRM